MAQNCSFMELLMVVSVIIIYEILKCRAVMRCVLYAKNVACTSMFFSLNAKLMRVQANHQNLDNQTHSVKEIKVLNVPKINK